MTTRELTRLRGPRRRAAAASVLALGLVMMLALVARGHSTDAYVIGLSLLVAALGVAILVVVSRSQGVSTSLALGKVGPWSALSFALIFGLASVTWSTPQTGTPALITQDSVLRALVLVSIGQLAWTAGYLVGPGAWMNDRFGDLMRWLVPVSTRGIECARSPWPLVTLGLTGAALRVETNGFGYLQDPALSLSDPSPFGQAITVLALMGDYAVVVAGVRYFAQPRHGSLATLVAIVTLQASIGLASGTKESVALVGLAVMLSYGAARGRFPLRVFLVCALLFVVVVVPFVAAYRTAVTTDSERLGTQAAIAGAPQVAADSVPTGKVSTSAELLSLRLREIDNVAIVAQKTPDEIPYRPITEFLMAPALGVVPRLLWADKPVLSGGYEFSQDYYELPPEIYTSSAVTPQGDLLRHGGPPVLLLGMGLLGVGYRLLDGCFRVELDYRFLFFVLAFFPALTKFEIDIVSLLATVPVAFVAPAVAVRLVSRRVKHETAGRLATVSENP